MPLENLYQSHLGTHSPNGFAENIARLKALFPELVTEGKQGASVNVDVLKQLVGDHTLTDADERYGLSWFGKRAARKLALTPSLGTLRPAPDESVDWDTTRNLMIEGDNLEILKLLQKSYAGKVKLIYIDPPYNRDADVLYPDDYSDSLKNYQILTGQADSDGRRLISVNDEDGRYHTKWLNIMLPRLKLARDFLRDDGLMLVSCDEKEIANIRGMMDEIFGEENFVGQWNWFKSATPPNLSFKIKRNIEYVLGYERNRSNIRYSGVKKHSSSDDPLTKPQNSEKILTFLPGQLEINGAIQKYAKGTYGTKKFANELLDALEVENNTNKNTVRFKNRFVWTQSKLDEELASGTRVRANPSSLVLSYKKPNYAEEIPPNLIDDRVGVETTEESAKELAHLMGAHGIFDYPKPVSLIKYLLGFFQDPGALVMDFFAGSGTTAHAVMEYNAENGDNRSCIVVQFPEALYPENKDHQKAISFCDSIKSPRNIAEITKERLRRAGSKIKAEHPKWQGDTGFRVFKLDTSNINVWNPAPADLEKTLFDHTEHLKADRSELDILYEIVLKRGLDLCAPVETREIAGKTVHALDGGLLMACLASSISASEAETLAQGIVDWRAALSPAEDTTCIFRDGAFENDVAKTNLAAILEQNGVKNVRSL
jgi:adenine-specific DNA-methyltransferase